MSILKIILPVCLLSLSGCAVLTEDLARSRLADASVGNSEAVVSVRNKRVKSIKEDETGYTQKLVCLGEKLRESYRELRKSAPDVSDSVLPKSFTVSVAPIFDKTGKVYARDGGTAISDIVLHGLSKLRFHEIVETPLEYKFEASRNNFSSPRYPSAIAADSKLLASGGFMPVGVLFPANMYVSGALVQYDDTSEIPAESLSADVKILTANRSVHATTVGINLRLVDAATGKVYQDDAGRVASVFLSNKLYRVSAGVNLYKIIKLDPYGIDYTADVADPVHYAVREVVEKALYELYTIPLGIPVSCE